MQEQENKMKPEATEGRCGSVMIKRYCLNGWTNLILIYLGKHVKVTSELFIEKGNSPPSRGRSTDNVPFTIIILRHF